MQIDATRSIDSQLTHEQKVQIMKDWKHFLDTQELEVLEGSELQKVATALIKYFDDTFDRDLDYSEVVKSIVYQIAITIAYEVLVQEPFAKR